MPPIPTILAQLPILARRSATAIGIAVGLAVACSPGPVDAIEQAGGFDGVYTGGVAVTSVRAVPCGAQDFSPSITIADGVASLVYLPGIAGKSVMLKAPVSHGGIFAGDGKGEFTINMSGSVSRDRIAAKAWAWNCEYALMMTKSGKASAAAPTASAQK